MSEVAKGNVARTRCRFRPRAGFPDVALADVTADIIEPADQATSLTVSQIGTNWFEADQLIPTGVDSRAWKVEWVSGAPSPIIRKTGTFYVVDD